MNSMETALRENLPFGGRTFPHKPTQSQRAVALMAVFVERVLTATLRVQWRGSAGFLPAPSSAPAIFCLWHNRLALCMFIHRKRAHRLAAMVSASKDGALLAAMLERFGVQPVRGSTSRRGPQALLEMVTCAQLGYDLAVTPDGPRGPRGVVQGGVIALAQVTGLPIVPVTWRSTWMIAPKSWDRFQVPVPFSRCEIIFNQPILVPRDADIREREERRRELESSLSRSSND